MTTTTSDVALGETGIDPTADSQTAEPSDSSESANEGDTSSGDEKFVPLSRFKEVVTQRNGDRELLGKLQSEHDQLLTWVHQKVVPALEGMESAKGAAGDSDVSDEYVDPLERQLAEQKAELAAMKGEMDKRRGDEFSRTFTKRVDALCEKYDLAEPTAIVDAYLKNPSSNFDFDAAAKRSHEKIERKLDSYSKRRADVSRAKKLQESSPASLAGKKKPRNSADASRMAREFFRNGG
jgi:hypothetical protein